MATTVDVPADWEALDLDQLGGLVLLLGAPDTGKSTLARHLFQRLAEAGRPVAYLDGDPGQSSLGPPTTMTLACSGKGDPSFPPSGRHWRTFVGSVSPRGHMLSLLAGAGRLVGVAQEMEARTILYDTTGLVNPDQGGVALKLAKLDLLRPRTVIALQQEGELEVLLLPLRRSRRVRLVELRPSPARRVRDRSQRQAHRARQFAAFFAGARPLKLRWDRLAVFPRPHFLPRRLVALEDGEGFTRGLGIVGEQDRETRTVTLLTAVESLEGVDALRLGDLLLDPETFREERLGPGG